MSRIKFYINMMVYIDIENKEIEYDILKYVVDGFNFSTKTRQSCDDSIDEEISNIFYYPEFFEYCSINEEEFKGKVGWYEFFGKGTLEYTTNYGYEHEEVDVDIGLEDVIYQNVVHIFNENVPDPEPEVIEWSKY